LSNSDAAYYSEKPLGSARRSGRFSYLWWLSLPRLTGSNTVYDYMKASSEDRVEFLVSLCNNGACLSVADWKCGFTNGNQGEVANCVENAVKDSKPWEKLDDIRKLCGRRFMVFDGGFGSKQECERDWHRLWGQK
jgi:hypothetical protein